MSRRPARREQDSFDEVADLARNGYRLASRIAEMVNIETKAYTMGQTAGIPDPVMTTVAFNWSSMTNGILNDPGLGDQDFQRIGDSIKIHNLKLNGLLFRASGVDTIAMRVILYWDEGNMSPNGTDVLYASGFGQVGSITTFKDWDKRKNTRILHDETFILTATAGSINNFGGNFHHFKISKKLGLHTQFEAGTQTIVTGALRIMFLSNSPSNSTAYFTSEIQYTDD